MKNRLEMLKEKVLNGYQIHKPFFWQSSLWKNYVRQPMKFAGPFVEMLSIYVQLSTGKVENVLKTANIVHSPLFIRPMWRVILCLVQRNWYNRRSTTASAVCPDIPLSHPEKN